MEEIIESVKRYASNTDENGHQELMDGLRKLSYSLETPRDTVQRFGFAHLEIAAVRIGIDLKLFDLLATTDYSLTVAELHQKTGAAPLLLGRLLRCLASLGTIKEVEMDKFTSTNITQSLATLGVQAGLYHQFYTCGPLYQELPDFLKKINYTDITDNNDTVHQVAHQTKLSAFPWFVEHPHAASVFNEYMQYHRKDQAICWDVYPVEEEVQGWGSNATVLVDMGGNLGHMSAAFKQKFPNVPGQVVLQDQAEPIGAALSTPGVKNMVHDIFERQPVKGAKFYYLRWILHDWPDDKSRQILTNITPAMSPASRILIDEMVLPDTRVHWQSTSTDLTMMAALAGRERTRTQWVKLLGSVGLEIEAVRTYGSVAGESVMTVGRKD